MRHRRKKKSTGEAVALFPFLAVLICTMGSLIVLLVVLVQQARLHAAESAADAVAEHEREMQDLATAQQDQQEKVDKLQTVRTDGLEKLDQARHALSHLENHIERLEKRWKQLVAQAKAMNQSEDEEESDRELMTVQRELLDEQIEKTKAEIDRLRGELAGRKPSFAIIPYQGRNGTQRRPIFIECKDDELIVQPEEIVLNLDDFEGPIGVGPGNPLDAVLRTVREHFAEIGGEPYPLIVVRPSGATAYGAARAAMSGWDDEFGYELIGADKQLKYPRADPMLAAKLADTVKRARARQQLLASAMPGGFRGGQARYIVKRRGGVERIDGPAPTGRSRGMENVDQGRAEDDMVGKSGADKKPETQGGVNGGGAPAAIANSKGSDWGVPNFNPNAQGYTRPVRVAIQPNAIMIMPPRGRYFAPITTKLNGQLTKDDSLRFVSKLWKHMETWGIAAQNGYWIPVMSVEVAPGAETQFDRFQHLMQDSGIQINRKTR